MKKLILTLLVFLEWTAGTAFANETLLNSIQQELAGLKQIIKEQNARIENLEARLQHEINDHGEKSVTSTHAEATEFHRNPDIGVVGDIVAKFDSPKADEEGADRISVREVEVILGSSIDPYSRFDATVSLSDFEEVSLEEAYLTHVALPWETTGRLGRFKPRVGKAIAIHRYALDTVDEPLVIQRYFGLEGYSKTGADLSHELESPWGMSHEVTLGILEGSTGEDGTLFGDSRREPTIYSHLKNDFNLNDATDFELGLSHLMGSRDDDSAFEVNVAGLDGTLIYAYGDRQHVKLQSEAFFVNRTELLSQHSWGSYLLLDWRFDPMWSVGSRIDQVQLISTSEDFAFPNSTEQGYTAYLTFHQSEFARWRMQYNHLDIASGDDDHQILLQGTFTLGEHKHETN